MTYERTLRKRTTPPCNLQLTQHLSHFKKIEINEEFCFYLITFYLFRFDSGLKIEILILFNLFTNILNFFTFSVQFVFLFW